MVDRGLTTRKVSEQSSLSRSARHLLEEDTTKNAGDDELGRLQDDARVAIERVRQQLWCLEGLLIVAAIVRRDEEKCFRPCPTEPRRTEGLPDLSFES